MKLTGAYLAADYIRQLKELDIKLDRLNNMLINYHKDNIGELMLQTTSNTVYQLSIEDGDVMYEVIGAAIKEYKDRRDKLLEKISEL